MGQPGPAENPQYCDGDGGRVSEAESSEWAAEPEESGIEEGLHQEVLPVDVDPPPDLAEARREEVVVVSAREVPAEEVEHSADQVEVTRDAKVQGIVRGQVEHRIAERADG